MRLPLTLLAAGVVVASPIIAQGGARPTATKPGSANPTAVTGGTYAADPNHTLIIWTLDHLGFSPLSGIVSGVTGTLTLDPKNPNGAKVDVTVPISGGISASAGLNAHLVRAGKDGGKPDFFGPAPADARFTSTRVVASGTKARIAGNLTLNGVTRPVTLDASFYGAGKAPGAQDGKENVGFKATAKIQRSAFGLGLAAPMVGDDVTLEIAAAFVKQ